MTDTPRETPEILTVHERLSARIRGLVSRGEEICNAFQSRPHDDGGLASLCACCGYAGDTHLLRDALLRIEYYAAECDTLRAQLAEQDQQRTDAENEIWDDVLRVIALAWPGERRVYGSSPLELVTDIIDERDAANTAAANWRDRLAATLVRAEQAEAQLAAREGEIATLRADVAQWTCNSRENKQIAKENSHRADTTEAQLRAQGRN